MLNLVLPRPLHSLTQERFRTAKTSGALLFFDTEFSILHTKADIPFQLRYCPALLKKPSASKTSQNTKQIDPFGDPSPDLVVASHLPNHNDKDKATHFLVLNKYPVIPQHLILATKTNKPQTQLLEADDLAITFASICAWEQNDDSDAQSYRPRHLFAFFNSGEQSGASQAHRHVQLLPIEEMSRDRSKGVDGLLIPLAERILSEGEMSKVSSRDELSMNEEMKRHLPAMKTLTTLPFITYALPIPPSPSPAVLHSMYKALYAAAVSAVKIYIDSDANSDAETKATKMALADTTDGYSAISYSFAMTRTTMCIMPRRRKGVHIHDSSGAEVGFVEVNGTILAGTLLCKREEERDVLRGSREEFERVLAGLGFPHPRST